MTSRSHIAVISLTMLCAILLLAGCAREQPEPTLAVAPQLRITAEVTAASTSTVIQAVANIPSVDTKPLATLDAANAVLASTTFAATATEESQPTRAFIGAIIDQDYVIPPSNTPRPTNLSPTIGATAQSSPLRTVVTTPLPINQIQLDGSRMGIQVHYNFDVAGWDRTLRQIAPLRMGWIKLQAAWEWLQPGYAGQFEQNFRLFQLHVQAAKKNSSKVLLSIAKAPTWARNVNPDEDGPPDDLRQLTGFIGVLLDKLGPYIDAIEIWNEPNLKREWTGDLAFNGAGYMELFRVGYDAVRAYSPNITVITAGLAPTGNSENISVDDRAFLQQMYQEGLAGYHDIAIGIHPYSWGNPPDFVCCNHVEGQGWDDRPQFFFLQTIRDYSDIIRANGHNVQMWATEFGWATWEGYPTQPPDPWMRYNSPLNQMEYTLRALQIGQSRPDIGVMILWNLNYAEEYTIRRRSELAAYSLLYPRFDGSANLQERPLYRALISRP